MRTAYRFSRTLIFHIIVNPKVIEKPDKLNFVYFRIWNLEKLHPRNWQE